MSETTQGLVSAALVAAQGSVKAAEFDATNPFFKSRYATLGAVIEASREALFHNGLAILQTPTVADHLVSLKTEIVHKSGQTIDCGTMSLPISESERNSDAQLAGAIITYLRRYAWSSVMAIYADQDTDGNDAPKTPPGAMPRRQNAREPKPPTTPPSAPAPVIGPKYRIQTLHRLQAAPGGPKRAVFHQYATVQGWITATQEPEDWPFDKIPATPEQFIALGEDLQRFERSLRESVATEVVP